MKKVALPEPEIISTSLGEVLSQRKSYLGGSIEKPLSVEDLGTLLGSALKKHGGKERRRYPSGGALFPIETYIISTLEQHGASAFHYNPSLHALEYLWDIPEHLSLKDLGRKPTDLQFSTLVVFTSIWKRSSSIYGDLSYLHALLEAGHMSQNVLLVSTAMGLNARPYAGFDDEELVRILDLDPRKEQPVHSIVMCR